VHVCPGVDQPGDVQHIDVAVKHTKQHRIAPVFTPKVDGNKCGKQAPEQRHHWLVVSSLKHHNRVGLEVTQVNTFARYDNCRMFAHQQPSDVREEEPTV